MPTSNRVLVQVDSQRNLIEIVFFGVVGAKEIESYEADVDREIAALKDGFFLLSDLTALDSMDVSCIPSIERTMDKLGRRGIARIVRIIPDIGKDIGLNIMSLFHYRRGLPIITCETREEAEQALK